jgi:hypothetical protein
MDERFPSYRTTELVPDRLYAVGGFVDAEFPVSWLPRGHRDYMPASCYLLKDSGKALLVDTGLPVHLETIRRDLADLVADCRQVDMIMSRREPDTILNLPPLIDALGIGTIYCSGIIDPLDFFDLMDEQNLNAQIAAETLRRPKWIVPGATLEIGRLRLSVSRSELRVLSAFHYFEETTRTLFGADSWTLLTQRPGERLAVVTDPGERISPAAILHALEDKFEWMLGARLNPVKECIAALSRFRPIERMCPTFGCVIAGDETIGTLLDNTVLALSGMEKRSAIDRLRGFDAGRFQAALDLPCKL